MNHEKVSIIGLGRLGTSLFHHFKSKDIEVKSIVDKNRDKLKTFRDKHLNIEFSSQIKDVNPQTTLLFICVPDDIIVKVAEELSQIPERNDQLLVVHTSGALSSDILHFLRSKGMMIGSFHPCASFSRDVPSVIEDITIAIEGGSQVLNRLQKFIHRIDVKCIHLKKEQKILYHAACVMASNFTVTLLTLAEEMMKHTQIETPHQLLMPLVQSTIQNVKNIGATASLTGPVARGDLETVRQHLNSIRQFLPHLLKPYVLLSELTVSLTEKQMDPNLIKEMRYLLNSYH